MPIITPAVPAQNSSYNVTLTTKAVLLREFTKAHSVMRRILKGEVSWNRLFKKLDFFKAYQSYLKVDILTMDQIDPIMKNPDRL